MCRHCQIVTTMNYFLVIKSEEQRVVQCTAETYRVLNLLQAATTVTDSQRTKSIDISTAPSMIVEWEHFSILTALKQKTIHRIIT